MINREILNGLSTDKVCHYASNIMYTLGSMHGVYIRYKVDPSKLESLSPPQGDGACPVRFVFLSLPPPYNTKRRDLR